MTDLEFLVTLQAGKRGPPSQVNSLEKAHWHFQSGHYSGHSIPCHLGNKYDLKDYHHWLRKRQSDEGDTRDPGSVPTFALVRMYFTTSAGFPRA